MFGNYHVMISVFFVQANLFEKQKAQVLKGVVDQSRKGSVDALIVNFLAGLNAQPDYFSLSSCSGRISLVSNSAPSDEEGSSEDKVRKKGCAWLLICHETTDADTVWNAVTSKAEASGVITLKFEPFILHVQCRSLDAAKILHTIALEVHTLLFYDLPYFENLFEVILRWLIIFFLLRQGIATLA